MRRTVEILAAILLFAPPVLAQMPQSNVSAEEIEAALGRPTVAGKPKFRAPSFETGDQADQAAASSTPPEKPLSISVIIEFKLNSAQIEPSYAPQLNEFVKVLKKNNDWRLKVIGHTDALGDFAKNIRLSEERAKAVRTFLLAKGVTASRLATEGRGSTDKLPDIAATDPRNRRVEFSRMDT